MKKYVIKNCPAFSSNFCGDDRKEMFCDEVSDCVMKKIVQEYIAFGLAMEILKHLEIEEVE